MNTMQEALDRKIRQKVVQFVGLVMDGHSYTEAWHRVTEHSAFGPATRQELQGRCVEAANHAVAAGIRPLFFHGCKVEQP